MVQPLEYRKETPSQTAGPYVHIGLAPARAGFEMHRQELGHDITGQTAEGTRITIRGRVTDGTGAAVRDVLIETWQANAAGAYPGAGPVEDGFRGWGRVIPDFDTGEWVVETIKPGAVTDRDGRKMAPHISLWLVARGINTGLNTRLYFGDEKDANTNDPVLNLIEQAHRRDTLIATPESDGYRFDISLQGDAETVFFDV